MSSTGISRRTLTIGIVAYKFELAGAFADALAAADLAISFAPPGENWIQGNRAHALMFLGHVDEARTIYLQHRGERIGHGKGLSAATSPSCAITGTSTR